MVKAGEVGGVLDQVLQRLVEYLASAEELRDEVISALTYPLILVGVGGVSVAILLIFVLPKFATMFADLGQTLPLSTRMMLAISDAATSPWSLIGVPLIIGGHLRPVPLLRDDAAAARSTRSSCACRWSAICCASPRSRASAARSACCCGAACRCCRRSTSCARSRAIRSSRRRSNEVQVGVREGAGMAGPLGRSGVFPQLALQMIAVGEDTGKLDEMLITTADFFDREVRNDVKRLTRLLEPAMILIMGLVVGFMVISMLMAVFSINDVDI